MIPVEYFFDSIFIFILIPYPFQVFGGGKLQGYTLQCWRVNSLGRCRVDHLVGASPGSENNVIPFLIHGGHIRLLVPAEREGATKLVASLTLAGLSDREWHCVVVPGKRPKCARCMGGGGKLGKVLPNVPWSFQERPIETQELIMLGSGGALKRRPSFAYGPRVEEVFAGAGVWTKAMTSAGIPANPPVELYTDPLRKTGKRKEFDLMDDQIAEHYLRAAQELPGPTVANVWELAPRVQVIVISTRSTTVHVRSPSLVVSTQRRPSRKAITFVITPAEYAWSSTTTTRSSSWSPRCPQEDIPRYGISLAYRSCNKPLDRSLCQPTYANEMHIPWTSRDFAIRRDSGIL